MPTPAEQLQSINDRMTLDLLQKCHYRYVGGPLGGTAERASKLSAQKLGRSQHYYEWFQPTGTLGPAYEFSRVLLDTPDRIDVEMAFVGMMTEDAWRQRYCGVTS